MSPYRAKDQAAIVGVSDTQYTRNSGRSAEGMVLTACIEAITDAGLTAADIDGIAGTTITPAYTVQAGLGVSSLKWWFNSVAPFHHQVLEAVHAVHAGLCETVVCYHGTYRTAGTSRSAAGDPIRTRYGTGSGYLLRTPDTMYGPHGYAAWCGRYLETYGVSRELYGLIAVNCRSNAALNPRAAMRAPLTMEAYFESPMVRYPFAVLDMDFPVDAAEAVIVTSAERARSLRQPPVLVHAAAMGTANVPYEDQNPEIDQSGQVMAAERLWQNSDVTLADVDLFMPYDGFTGLAALWTESIGYCERGEALSFFQDNWDKEENRLRLNGHVLVNSHGGSLSGGATQGANHVREAVAQLRGDAGERQATPAETALITFGGMFYNCGAVMLRGPLAFAAVVARPTREALERCR